jgi:hypothetical protein
MRFAKSEGLLFVHRLLLASLYPNSIRIDFLALDITTFADVVLRVLVFTLGDRFVLVVVLVLVLVVDVSLWLLFTLVLLFRKTFSDASVTVALFNTFCFSWTVTIIRRRVIAEHVELNEF